MLPAAEIKQNVADYATQLIQPGMTVGIGTGTTATFFIKALALRVKQGLRCVCVPTSTEVKLLAEKLGLTLTTLNDVSKIDIDIDGADEIDPQLCLIKGGGGALLQEKMVAAASKQFIVIADSSKMVKQLGSFALPVEVIPFGWKQVQQHITSLFNISVILRSKNDSVFVTDHGHYILDASFGHINHPDQLCKELNNIPGVVENGLFIEMANSVIIGFDDGRIKEIKK